MLITFSLMLGLAAVAKPFVLVLIGEQWLPCVPYLQIICFQMMLYPLHALNLNMLQVQGRSDLFLRLEIFKKCIAVIPLMLGIFVDIYWMLWGSVIGGLFAYYLNAYYSGPFLNYSIKEQVKDIIPSFVMALTMGIIVFSISLLNISPFVQLPLQILVGATLTIVMCEFLKREEYLEIKKIVLRKI